MKYITIDFRIEKIKPKNKIKDIGLCFESINRSIAYNRFKLGNDFIDLSDGNHTFEETDCPFCDKSHTCEIITKIYSADNLKRILEVKCIHSDKFFSSYQEGIDKNQLN